jgi:hypothetical protein
MLLREDFHVSHALTCVASWGKSSSSVFFALTLGNANAGVNIMFVPREEVTQHQGSDYLGVSKLESGPPA